MHGGKSACNPQILQESRWVWDAVVLLCGAVAKSGTPCTAVHSKTLISSWNFAHRVVGVRYGVHVGQRRHRWICGFSFLVIVGMKSRLESSPSTRAPHYSQRVQFPSRNCAVAEWLSVGVEKWPPTASGELVWMSCMEHWGSGS